ncbi:hypothetical protein [Salinactinospora qingdaonensis]|uniref:Uncharacterized protein n=1 Tax=Salinactinospora qingdaonensis TaxID=702744 RepID=A0ABP7G3Z7_9ACTN
MSLPRLLSTVVTIVLTAAMTLLAGGAAGAEAQQAFPRRWASPETTTVTYGPFTIPAATQSDGGGHGENGHTGNRVEVDVEKPCENCFITGFEPDLVYADGSTANVNTGPMMHHAVMFRSWTQDLTCPGPQRIFATGNERVASTFPDGYGFKVGLFEEPWNLVFDLMNHAHQEKEVYISFTFTHESALGSDVEPVTPIWLDVGGCAGSTYTAPQGVSEESTQWESTISGELVHMRGHLHHGGTRIRTENLTTGQTLCRTEAEEGGTPEFITPHGHTEISDLPPCSGDTLGSIDEGDVLQTTSRYELPNHAHDDVMGIMVGWVDQD